MNKIIFNEEERKKIINLYNNELISSRKVGEEFGVDRTTILKMLKEEGINTNGGYRRKKLFSEKKIIPNRGMLNKKHTFESKNKISEALKGEKNPFYGKKHTEESRKKISEGNKGKVACNKILFNEEQIKEIGGLYEKDLINCENIGKKFNVSPPTIKKLLNKEGVNTSLKERTKLLYEKGKLIPYNKGKIFSKETRLKMSKVRLGRTWEQLYGEDKARELKEKAKMRIKKNCPVVKGKNYEQKYGVEKANEIKAKLSLLRSGDKSYLWKGGKSFEPYDKCFNNKFKRAIRKRDNQVCMLCGIHREKLRRALDVHHIDYNKLNTFPQNCISLCQSCHTKTNENREEWTKLCQTLMTKRYNYQYSNNGDLMINIGEKNGI